MADTSDMAEERQLSRGGAVAMGLACMLAGIMPALIGAGYIHTTETTPLWVASVAGLMFIAAGLAIIFDYAIAGGVGPDGDLLPGTPIGIRIANLFLALVVIGGLGAIAGWVAFGSGPRAFSSTFALPFVSIDWLSGERSGRIAFGLWSILCGAMFVACAVIGVRRLVRAWREQQGDPRI